MWISKIEIRNFRPFYGEHKIEFKKESKEKFTVIEAKSDVGKTSLLSAITWCFYGKDFGEHHPKVKSVFNSDREHELADGKSDEVIIRLTLNDDHKNLIQYIVTRKATYRKSGNTATMEEDEPRIEIIEWDENEAGAPERDQSICKRKIHSILPENIHVFFLFEGEKLEKHFSFRNPEQIKETIEDISQIRQLRTALRHLNSVKSGLFDGSDGSEISEEHRRDRAELEKSKSQKSEKEADIRKYTEAVRKAKDRISEIDRLNASSNSDRINEWVDFRGKLEKNNDEMQKIILRNEDELKQSLLVDVPLSVLSKPLEDLLVTIKKTKGLPPKIQKPYLLELMDAQECVCGRNLNPKKADGKEAIAKLNHIIETKEDLTPLLDTILGAKVEISGSMKTLPENFNKRKVLYAQNAKLIKTIGENEIKIEEYSENLRKANADDIRTRESERRGLLAGSESQIESIGRLRGEVGLLNSQINEYTHKVTAHENEDKSNREKVKISRFMGRAILSIESIQDEILIDVRKTVQDKTFESFLQLHWDKKMYKKFSIDDNYYMSLIDSNGKECIFTLASGTKQILLLSFLSSLAKVSGFRFPIFIDTPLANTDNEQRMNIAKNIHGFLKGNQVVLLVKDQEYSPSFRDAISKGVGTELRLVRELGEYKTEVKKWD